MVEDGLCQVLAAFLLDSDGQRLAVKYSRPAKRELWPNFTAQRAFEAKLAAKLPKPFPAANESEPNVMMVDEYTVIYQAGNDVVCCAVTASAESELVVLEVVECLWAAMMRGGSGILSNGPTKQTVIDYLTEAYFFLDEILDDGMVMETDEKKVQARIQMADETEAEKFLERQEKFQKATQSAKKKIISSLMGGGTG